MRFALNQTKQAKGFLTNSGNFSSLNSFNKWLPGILLTQQCNFALLRKTSFLLSQPPSRNGLLFPASPAECISSPPEAELTLMSFGNAGKAKNK